MESGRFAVRKRFCAGAEIIAKRSITKTDKWLKLLTLPLPISKCLQVSTMFASLTAGLIKNRNKPL